MKDSKSEKGRKSKLEETNHHTITTQNTSNQK